MVDLASTLTLMADDPWKRRRRPVERRLAQIVDALERARARYAIAGAVALGAHGVRRFTEDIDVLVEAEAVDRLLAAARTAFREIAREPATGAPGQIRLRARKPLPREDVYIDILVPVDAAEAWALAGSVRAKALGRKVD
ncbi:MAG: nucleotidyl transferase AbiEii/AbiGii toxin family protein, partial [Myxococcota bacterium]